MKTWLIRRPVRSPMSLRHDGAQELVGVQTALHQQLGFPLAHQLHRFGRGPVAVRNVHDPRAAERQPAVFGDLPDLRLGPDQDRHDQPVRTGFERAGQRRFLARVGHCGRHRLETAAPNQQLFVFSGSCLSGHVASRTGAGARG